jgi:hypothetical protein
MSLQNIVAKSLTRVVTRTFVSVRNVPRSISTWKRPLNVNTSQITFTVQPHTQFRRSFATKDKSPPPPEQENDQTAANVDDGSIIVELNEST